MFVKYEKLKHFWGEPPLEIAWVSQSVSQPVDQKVQIG